jgi:hypothetical protein
MTRARPCWSEVLRVSGDANAKSMRAELLRSACSLSDNQSCSQGLAWSVISVDTCFLSCFPHDCRIEATMYACVRSTLQDTHPQHCCCIYSFSC